MKSKISQKKQQDNQKGLNFPSAIAIAVVLTLFALGIVSFLGTELRESDRGLFRNEVFMLGSSLLASMTTLLLVILLAQYLQTYSELHSEFTLALIVMALGLLLNSAASNPLLFTRFGYGPMGGPFSFLPQLFTFAVTIMLLILNNR